MRQLISASKSFFSNEHLPPIARSIAGFLKVTWDEDKEKTLAILRQKRNWIAKIRIPIIQNPFIIFLYLIPIMLILAFLGWSGKMLVIHFSGGDKELIVIFLFCWIIFFYLSLICSILILDRLQSYPKMKQNERWLLVKKQYLKYIKEKKNSKNIISRILNNKSIKNIARQKLEIAIKDCERKSKWWFGANFFFTPIIVGIIVSNTEFQKAIIDSASSWLLTYMFDVNFGATLTLFILLVSWFLYFCKYGVYIAWMKQLQKELKKEN